MLLRSSYAGVVVLATFSLLACGPNASLESSGSLAQDLSVSRFAPVEDARVEASHPDQNFGHATSLVADGSPAKQSLLKFNVAGLGGTVRSAKLRVFVSNGSSDGPRVYLTSNGWAEGAVTWNTKPSPIGAATADAAYVAQGAWLELDVTPVVQGAGVVSFLVVPTSSDAVVFDAREGTNPPQLWVSTDSPDAGATTLDAGSTTQDAGTSSTDAGSTDAGSLATDGGSTSQDAGVDPQPAFPIRATFYYAWFPETWGGTPSPFTHYHPDLGYYRSDDPAVIARHLQAMQYANLNAAISSWWGQGHYTDTRLAQLLAATAGSKFRWSIYYEKEGSADPSVSEIQSDLQYIVSHYGSDPSYLRVGGKPVVFVYADGNDGCAMADRWKQANTVGAFVVLKVLAGFSTCASQPQDWHQYGPSTAEQAHLPHSFVISPGFWKADEATPRLARDVTRFKQNVRDMIASGARWQLVTTFNEWGEGTATEGAQEWASPSGFGEYLDALHSNGL